MVLISLKSARTERGEANVYSQVGADHQAYIKSETVRLMSYKSTHSSLVIIIFCAPAVIISINSSLFAVNEVQSDNDKCSDHTSDRMHLSIPAVDLAV